MSSIFSFFSFKTRPVVAAFAITTWLIALTAFGQTPQSNDVRELPPNQTIEREMTGAETHRYKFDLKANEFFQVRVEQKGVDVTLKLSDASGIVVATMDSPNGKEGPETLSFVATVAGNYELEVSSFDAKAEKGNYSILREASRTATSKDRRRVEVEQLFFEGMNARTIQGKSETAVKKLAEALSGWQELNDEYLSNLTKQVYDITSDLYFLSKIDVPIKKNLNTNDILKQKSPEALVQARREFREALRLYRDYVRELLARSFSKEVQRTTLKADSLLNAKWGEVNSLSGIANTYDGSTEAREKIEYSKLAIVEVDNFFSIKEIQSSQHFAKARNQLILQKAGLLSSLAITQNSNDVDLQAALAYAQQALDIYQQVSSENLNNQYEAKFQSAQVLDTIGRIYQKLDDFPNAVKNLELALSIYEKLPIAKLFEIDTLMTIALTHFRGFDYQNALHYLHQSLRIAEASGDTFKQSKVLDYIGIVYFDLGDEEKIRETARAQLPLLLSDKYLESVRNSLKSQLNSTSGVREGSTQDRLSKSDLENVNEGVLNTHGRLYELLRLMDIGFKYKVLEEYEKSAEFYDRALTLARIRKDISLESAVLTNIGDINLKQKKPHTAIGYFKLAVNIERQLQQKSFLAASLRDIGFAYLESGKPEEALPYLSESLSVWTSIGADKDQNIYRQYATTLSHIARAYKEAANTKLAIMFGKLAVNAIQRERRQLTSLDRVLQRGYLKKNEKPYRRLADWLIAEGRFAQAEQVLAMLKEEEYFDFVRRDADEIKSLNQRVPLNDKEQKLIARYSLLADRITTIGQEFLKLDEKKRKLPERVSLPPDERKRFEELSTQLTDANAAFKLFLEKELVAELGKETIKEIEYDRNLQAKLRKWGAGTVALRTVVTEERYRVILTTPTVQVDGKSEIKSAELNKKVFAFREALQNPKRDPRPLGKEIYDILIKPIEKDLRAAGAKTLVWSLDGTLRYIPLAALSPDGKTYLIEKYQNVIITPKTADDISDSSAKWQALGMGVSTPQSVANPDKPEERFHFSALPGTKLELLAIVQDEKTPGETGVMIGRRYLDKDFTIQNLTDSLTKETAKGNRQYTVVHVASHFRLGSNWSNSFLLLGNGEVLTLEQLNNSPEISFGDVELITLSACNTAFADESNGKEVDSLAEAIQTKSGKAVLATLWSVADESTQLLMSEFYRIRKRNPQLTKAAALQMAQQEMIAGRLKALSEIGERRDTGEAASASTDYSHPYYWSPFVLIGNWR